LQQTIAKKMLTWGLGGVRVRGNNEAQEQETRPADLRLALQENCLSDTGLRIYKLVS
jgi:hypothetical protein